MRRKVQALMDCRAEAEKSLMGWKGRCAGNGRDGASPTTSGRQSTPKTCGIEGNEMLTNVKYGSLTVWRAGWAESWDKVGQRVRLWAWRVAREREAGY